MYPVLLLQAYPDTCMNTSAMFLIPPPPPAINLNFRVYVKLRKTITVYLQM